MWRALRGWKRAERRGCLRTCVQSVVGKEYIAVRACVMSWRQLGLTESCVLCGESRGVVSVCANTCRVVQLAGFC